MPERFDGKVALITGAAGGIGRATAQRFVDEGAKVVLIDLDAQALETLAEDLGPENALACATDVTDEAAIKAAVALAVETFGRLDVLFNNAGIICDAAPVNKQSVDVWNKTLSVNVVGAVLFSKYAASHLTASKGSIINTASVAGIRAGAGGNAYSASKAAVINLTQTMACDFGTDGVRVNAVCPGLIETNMTKPVFDYARAAGKEEKLGARCELRRYGRSSEIASVVAFLASDDASYVTGQAIAVDGGNTASLNLPGMKF